MDSMSLFVIGLLTLLVPGLLAALKDVFAAAGGVG